MNQIQECGHYNPLFRAPAMPLPVFLSSAFHAFHHFVGSTSDKDSRIDIHTDGEQVNRTAGIPGNAPGDICGKNGFWVGKCSVIQRSIEIPNRMNCFCRLLILLMISLTLCDSTSIL
jgi:hypothetical protein